MKTYRVNKTINASPETIWEVLTDASKYPEWDPNVDKIEGAIAPGNSIKVFTKLQPGQAFPATVKNVIPNQTMTWSGGLPLGLFKGERTFTLTPKSDNSTEFAMQEVFSGLLFALIGRTIPDLTNAFETFATGLKQRAESMR